MTLSEHELPNGTNKPAGEETSAETLVVAHFSKADKKDETNASNVKFKKKKKGLIANVGGTRYDAVKECLEKCGFATIKDEKDDPNCLLYWSDLAVPNERISEMKPYQRINHFPGMVEVCRKDCLAKNMAKMQKLFPDEFDFTPRTWNMPQESNIFLSQAKESAKKKKRPKTYIAKPSNGAMGNGIRLFRNLEKAPLEENYIIQEYLDKPMLLEGFKFDMRVYVLVTSCDPLKIFLFKDGLVRISTKNYAPPTDTNIEDLFMHLTNYSVNKNSATYEKHEDESKGSKRNFDFLNDWLKAGNYDVQKIWREISDVIVKTLLVAEPHLIQQYRMCRPGVSPLADSTCFEILGFDIFLDRRGKPWLIEINRSPSFGTNEKIDLNIKTALLTQSFKLLRIRASDKKRSLTNQKIESQKRLFNGNRRVSVDQWDKSKAARIRRKEQLQIQLAALRKEAARQEYESKNLGKFRRIFPMDDRSLLEHYVKVLSKAFDVLLAGRANQIEKEVISNYQNPFQESDLLDMIEQCECEEGDMNVSHSGTIRKVGVPKTLSSMPSTSPKPVRDPTGMDTEDSCDYESSDEENIPKKGKETSDENSAGDVKRKKNVSKRGSQRWVNNYYKSQKSDRPTLASRSSSRSLSSLRFENNRSLPPSKRKRDEDEIIQLYNNLSELNIKFPGKTQEEATEILNSILDNWSYHKPRVANYWLVKLDATKRHKVVDIVRNNVRAVLQKFYENQDMERKTVTKNLNKVFNRMLWSHGQGLWSCLNHTTMGPAPWEAVFRTGHEVLSNAEMGCCRIAVELCKDCLLVVYQFANQSRTELSTGATSVSSVNPS